MKISNQKLAQAFVDRAKEQGMKGKARDRAALEFLCGAAAIIEQLVEQKESHGANVAALCYLTSVRGYSFVEEVAAKESANG